MTTIVSSQMTVIVSSQESAVSGQCHREAVRPWRSQEIASG